MDHIGANKSPGTAAQRLGPKTDVIIVTGWNFPGTKEKMIRLQLYDFENALMILLFSAHNLKRLYLTNF